MEPSKVDGVGHDSEESTLHEDRARAGGDPTRSAKRSTAAAEPATTLDASPFSKPGAPFVLSVEALRKEERWRLRVTGRVMIGVVSTCLLLASLMGGDPLAKRVYIAGLVFAVVIMTLLLRLSYVSRYSMNRIGIAGVALTITNTCGLYYIGTFSETAMPGALALYIFCLGGSSTLWASAVYAALAVPHALLATLIMLGWLPDRGLVSAATLSISDQLGLLGFAQLVYFTAFGAGRATRRKLERVFGELEGAARLIAQRDALLHEANRELERVRVGGEGLFSGHVVGSFRLGKLIGRGGMGEVYEATHTKTQDEAAVKLLQRNLLADPQSLARFARETQATQALHSPHVVRAVEIPKADSPVPYLAMERLRGEDLASMLRREHRVSARELAELVRQVGSGLDAARSAGVIHRDIKPQNLFLARRDDAAPVWKILDFGVSRLSGQATLTNDELVGTPGYMAPEQAAGKPLDHRVDLYGLAAVSYRCLAARAPFAEDSLAALVHKMINHMPPRPSDVARVPRDLEAFLAIGLAKDPNDRFASGEELAEAFALAAKGDLSPALRERAAHILERTPWAES